MLRFTLYNLTCALKRAPIDQWNVYEGLLLGRVGEFSKDGRVVSSDARQLTALEVWGQQGAGSRLPPLSRRLFRSGKRQSRSCLESFMITTFANIRFYKI